LFELIGFCRQWILRRVGTEAEIVILLATIAVAIYRRLGNFRCTPAPFIPAEIKTVLRGGEAAERVPVGAAATMPSLIKFFHESEADANLDPEFIVLASNPQVINACKHVERLGA
jgi:hypothetical protein